MELDKPLLSLENLKKIVLCIDCNQDKNINWEDIYGFLQLIYNLLHWQNEEYLQTYISNVFSYLGYKFEGIENVENRPETLSSLFTAKKFCENAINTSDFLECIKALGFKLILNGNEIFKLEKVDEVDKLIASIGYLNKTELNNWVKGVNTIKAEDRNEIAQDENANDNYLEIKSLNNFKNMKRMLS